MSKGVDKRLKGEKDIDETELNKWLATLREYANPANELKNTVYTANYGNDLGNKYYEIKVKKYYKLLCELKVWKACGFNKVEEILKANANGIKIAERGTSTGSVLIGDATHRGLVEEKRIDGTDDPQATANIAEIKKVLSGGKYKGVKVYDVNKEQEEASEFEEDGTMDSVTISGFSFNTMKVPYEN
ncbi:1526_t:CDS:2 [Ambispora leptoticha]|uniref:1526_t:CDS:1 n=1 Tax=Ambispora leptoticha TaxID=144679 RepID=A0A9N9DTH3_9GLOM|nr:1526_t:CDS:2 [Ambispora leptoticha]